MRSARPALPPSLRVAWLMESRRPPLGFAHADRQHIALMGRGMSYAVMYKYNFEYEP